MWLRGTKFSSWRYYFSTEERSRQWLDKALNLLSSKAALNMKWFQKGEEKSRACPFYWHFTARISAKVQANRWHFRFGKNRFALYKKVSQLTGLRACIFLQNQPGIVSYKNIPQWILKWSSSGYLWVRVTRVTTLLWSNWASFGTRYCRWKMAGSLTQIIGIKHNYLMQPWTRTNKREVEVQTDILQKFWERYTLQHSGILFFAYPSLLGSWRKSQW